MAQFKVGDLRETALPRFLVDPDTGEAVGSQGTPAQVALPSWHYIGGECVVLDGTNPANVPNVPADTEIIEIDANGGEVYVALNAVTADALAPFYMADGGARIFGPVCNLVTTGIWLFSETADTKAHVSFWKEC